MMKRIEFTLDLDDPHEAALYEALAGLLRHRRAGALIRQALTAFLFDQGHPTAKYRQSMPPETRRMAPNAEDLSQTDDTTTARIVEQSASMFGFR